MATDVKKPDADYARLGKREGSYAAVAGGF